MPLLSRGGSSSVLLFGGRSGGLIGRPGAGAARIGGAAPAGRGALDRIDLRPEILGPEGVAEYRRFLRQLPAHRVILYDRAGIVEEEIGKRDRILCRQSPVEYADQRLRDEIGRASCRERVCPYVEISVLAVSL